MGNFWTIYSVHRITYGFENNYRKRILENIWCSFGDLCCFIWISIPIHFYGYGSLGPSKNRENYRFELFKLINSEEKLLLNDSPPPYIFIVYIFLFVCFQLKAHSFPQTSRSKPRLYFFCKFMTGLDTFQKLCTVVWWKSCC